MNYNTCSLYNKLKIMLITIDKIHLENFVFFYNI